MLSPLMVSLLAAAWLSVAPYHEASAGGGRSGSFCDNGKVSLHRDLPLDSGWTCPHAAWTTDTQDGPSSIDTVYDPQPSREICMDRPIGYKHSIPHSGPYRPIRAESGQYLYCPPQRWINNLHQGAVVLLYHPCAPLGERTRLSALAQTCLSDYVMTSHRELRRDKPLALVSWGRTLELTSVATSAVCDWLEETGGRNRGDVRPARTRKYSLLLQRSAAERRKLIGGPGHAGDTIRRCCEKSLFPLLDGGDQRMKRSLELTENLNLTVSSASVNQTLELLRQEAHNTELHQEAHNADLNQEAHTAQLHREAHNTSLHQEAHNTDLHQQAHNAELLQEAHDADLHQEAHNTQLHQEAHKNNLHQEAHNTDLNQEAHNTTLHQEAHNADLHQEAHNTREAPSSPVSNQDPTSGPKGSASSGPHTPVDPHTADPFRSSSDPEPQRSSSNPKSPPAPPAHPSGQDHSHHSEDLKNVGSVQRSLSPPPSAQTVQTGSEALETDGRRDKDVAQRNVATETKAAGDKRTNDHVSHRHNVTPYAAQRKTAGHAEEKRKDISLLDVTEREVVKTHTHGNAHGDAHARSKTRKSRSTSPPPPHTPPPKLHRHGVQQPVRYASNTPGCAGARCQVGTATVITPSP